MVEYEDWKGGLTFLSIKFVDNVFVHRGYINTLQHVLALIQEDGFIPTRNRFSSRGLR